METDHQEQGSKPRVGHNQSSVWFTALQGLRVLFTVMSRKPYLHSRVFLSSRDAPISRGQGFLKIHLFQNTFFVYPLKSSCIVQ